MPTMQNTRLAAALALAALTVSPAGAQGDNLLAANLFGDQVEGGGAGERATGDFNGLYDRASGELCYYLEADGIGGDATAAHIHKGKRGSTGAEVVTLEMAEMDEACVAVEAGEIAAMLRSPEDYYVDIHTAAHQGGAVRGQLKDD